MVMKNKNTPQNQIKDKTISTNRDLNKIILDFNSFLFTPIKLSSFTNYFKNESEKSVAYKNFFHSFIPHVTNKTFEELKSEGHNHEINDKEKILLIKKILSEYFKNNLFTEFEFEQFEDDIFQLSSSGGMRVIGLRIRNIFRILFLDPHHLIYRDSTFGKDWKHYNYSYKICDDELIKIVNFDDCISEKCYECEEFIK